MGYFTKSALGLALLLAGAVTFCYRVYELGKTGTCASGGPYVSARECPSGTGTLSLMIAPAVLAAIAGGGIFATRGRTATAPGLPPTSAS